MNSLLKPSQLAEMLDVSEPTIRRWSLRFKAFLSDYATPTQGSRRRLTEQDVLVLRRVKALVDAGFSLDAIETQLQQEPAEPLPELSSMQASDAKLQDPFSAIAQALAQIATQDERIARLEARFERLREEVKTLKTGQD